MTEILLTGGCHCGDVRFEIFLTERPTLIDCNCSICRKSGYVHLNVPRSHFRLLKGEDRLENYRFNSGEAVHFFCKKCGIKSFYIPRSHPDHYSINARCLDDFTISDHPIITFDGQNWEDNVHKIHK